VPLLRYHLASSLAVSRVHPSVSSRARCSATHARHRVLLHAPSQVSSSVPTRHVRRASRARHRQQPLGSFLCRWYRLRASSGAARRPAGVASLALSRGFPCRRVCTVRLPAVASSSPTRQSTGPSKAVLLPSGYLNVRPRKRTTGPPHVSNQYYRVVPVPLPPESGIAKAYASTNLADAYSIELPTGASTNPELLARFIFSHLPPWASRLMAVRDALVAGFGLKTAKHLMSPGAESRVARVSIFRIYSTSQTEIVLGEDDKHLDFRLSVSCSGEPSSGSRRHVILSTVVHCHNRLGRLYLRLIAPFHRLIVQSSLRRAARIGWPPATEA
jgi:hypothetical protein